MNHAPLSAPLGSSDAYLLDLMRQRNVAAVPVVSAEGVFRKLVHLSDLRPEVPSFDVADFAFAVIMAGGEGTRLRPITQTIPKPMVEVGGMPLIERQVDRLASFGVTRVYIAVNYLSHVIEEHFGDGSRFGIEIRYLREQEKLGTAGALALIQEVPERPVVVMNGDILTNSDFASLSVFHDAHAADVTVAAIDYKISIPFGVIECDGATVRGIAEKPSQRFLCNAGIYSVSPRSLALVPANRRYNMTDLIADSISRRWTVAVYPVHEYWSDIGTVADLEKARAFFAREKS
jgi:NDP-sugar pyrophosphorylase family protein